MNPLINQPSGRQLAGFSGIPPLEPGDRLTRDEFERRYEAMPEVKKAELIEGFVYMPFPVRLYRHAQPHSHLVTCFGNYRAATPGVGIGDNSTARLDLDNEPQPDAMLFILPDRGGQARVSEDDYLEGAPELVAEIASSSVSFDLHTKKNVYRRCGVREYVVWRVLEGEIDWFALEAGEYKPVAPDAAGFVKSRVFPGLWLDSAALVAGDLTKALAAVQAGIASAEHGEFVRRLASVT
jgi:Uma2 family endonuclease